MEVKVHHEQEISATQDAQTGITCQEAHRIVASHQYWVFIGDHPAFDELQRHYSSNAPEDFITLAIPLAKHLAALPAAPRLLVHFVRRSRLSLRALKDFFYPGHLGIVRTGEGQDIFFLL